MNKIFRITLKIKVIVLLILLLGGSLAFFTKFSVDLFKKDKAAYIYETSLSTSEIVQGRIDQYLAKTARDYQLINKILTSEGNENIAREIFNAHPDSLYFKANSLTFTNENLLNSLRLTTTQGLELLNFEGTLLAATSSGLEMRGLIFDFGSYFLFTQKGHDTKFIINSSEILKPLEDNEIYTSFLYSSKNNFSFPLPKENLDVVAKLLNKNSMTKTVQEISIDGELYLLSYSKLRSFDFYVLSLIKHKKAFQAATFLSKKSLYFGIMILGCGIILGVLFSRSLTKPLETLYQQTLKIAAGDFTGQINAKSNDEIGSLSKSFNFMSTEILRYMDEMKEKARLENEVAVAKLVQDSFFPPLQYNSSRLSLSAFYTPASECGGDWFQVINIQNKTIILMADATGHGVPAAFLTASIYTVFNTFIENIHNNEEILYSTSKLLEKINNVLCMTQTNLFLTCFAAIIDEDTGEMIYSNASHMDPFLIHEKAGTYEKQDVIPLIEAKGPRLGHNKENTFPEVRLNLSKNDTLVILTDGIFESHNPETKQYGQRNFLKSLCNHLPKETVELQESLISDLKGFCGPIPFEDDVTLIVLRTKV